MTRIDPYKHEERYRQWKLERDGRIPGVTVANADLIRRFLFDMELGLNVSRTSKRGPRSYIRLNTLRARLTCLARRFTDRFAVDVLTDVTEEQAHVLFGEMRDGTVRRRDGQAYVAAGDYIKDFKSFWHWHMQVSSRRGVAVTDICSYLHAKNEKPKWVYLTEQEVKRLCDEAKYEYRVLIRFLFDSGMRSPSELINIRVSDFQEDFARVQIRDEVSKTFGRRINLLLCACEVREYVKRKGLTGHDIVFPISPPVVNRYLKRLASRVLGDATSLGGERYGNLTLYDFRHISACFWLPRYKSESALKYRFGWKKTERIHYYTELLGMKDDITEDDLLLGAEKTEVERRLTRAERDKEVVQERLDTLQRQMERISDITEKLMRTIGASAVAI